MANDVKTSMNINDQLYVEIVPYEGHRPPSPHPMRDGGFDASLIYKVLGMYNASETSECYFILANPQREIWFIPQRHLRAWDIIDSKQFFLRKKDHPHPPIALPGEGRRESTAPPTRIVTSSIRANGF